MKTKLSCLIIILLFAFLSACGSPPLVAPEQDVDQEITPSAQPEQSQIDSRATRVAQSTITSDVAGGSNTSPIIPSPTAFYPSTTPPSSSPSPLPTIESPIDRPIRGYIFNQPKLIVETDQIIEIAQWIPDSKENLLVRSSTIDKFTVEVFNTITGKREILSETDSLVGNPVWLSATKQAAYLSQEKNNNGLNLFLTEDNEQKTGLEIVGNLNTPLVPDSNGATVITFDQEMKNIQRISPQSRDVEQLLSAVTSPVSFPIIEGGPFARYLAAWNDKTDWVAYYNSETFRLVNLQTSEIREINLGEKLDINSQINCVKWSPDGQKLALIIGEGVSVPLISTKLAIFDPETENLTTIENDLQYIMDIAWAPDSEHVLLEAQIGLEDGFSIRALFIADAVTKQVDSIPILPKNALSGSFCDGLVWSPDGKAIVVSYGNKSTPNVVGWYRIEVEKGP